MPLLRPRGRRLAAGVALTLTAGLAAAGAVALPSSAATPSNLVANPSAETAVKGLPKGWTRAGTGTNTRTLSYPSGGAKAGKRFVRTAITKYTSGGGGWLAPAASVTGGASYTVSDWYRSGVRTRIDLQVTVKGKVQYVTLGTVAAARSWAAASFVWTAPAGATAVRIAHVLPAKGTLDVDAAGLAKRAAAGTTATRPATTGLVSVTFDDGWSSQYTNALPVLKARRIPGTFYLVSSYLGSTDFVTVAQAKEFQAAGGEIGSHTVDHADLATLTSAQVTKELADSKAALEANFGPVTDLAYPYGSNTPAVRAEAAKYYASARTTVGGTNAKGAYDRYGLTIRYVFNTTTTAQVQSYLADAKAKGTWLVLLYHSVRDGQPNDEYSVTVPTFTAQMNAVAASGLRPVTVRDGLAATS